MPWSKRILPGRLDVVQQLRGGKVVEETDGIDVVQAVLNAAALPLGGSGVTMHDSSAQLRIRMAGLSPSTTHHRGRLISLVLQSLGLTIAPFEPGHFFEARSAVNDAYESDFYAWAQTQATLLRSGRLEQADIEHIAEEIESMGKSELRELENRLALLFMHLLKWQYQPTLRCRSWELTIREQRRRLRRHFAQNPSLKAKLSQAIDDAYGDAILEAARETGLDEDTFPSACPFTQDDTMHDGYWPK